MNAFSALEPNHTLAIHWQVHLLFCSLLQSLSRWQYQCPALAAAVRTTRWLLQGLASSFAAAIE